MHKLKLAPTQMSLANLIKQTLITPQRGFQNSPVHSSPRVNTDMGEGCDQSAPAAAADASSQEHPPHPSHN